MILKYKTCIFNFSGMPVTEQFFFETIELILNCQPGIWQAITKTKQK